MLMDDIDAAYRHLIATMSHMREGYRAVTAVPDRECDADHRADKPVQIAVHRAFVRKATEVIGALIEAAGDLIPTRGDVGNMRHRED
jgi:hypothetical protein